MGAPQNRLYELAMELKLLGWEVEIITAMPNYPTGRIFKSYKGRFYKKDDLFGLNIHRYWLYPSNSSQVLPRIISMLSFSVTSVFSWRKVRVAKPDYLLVESPPLTLGFAGWIISKLAGTRFIMNVSDLWPLSARELGVISDGFIYRRLTSLESFLYHKATMCTGQSQEIVDYICKIKKDQVWLLRNGVDVSRFQFHNKVVRSNKIVYAGLLGVAQGILSICENMNFKELGLELDIYGSGNELEKIRHYLMANPDKGIRYCGVITREQIPIVLIEYDAMLVALVKNIYGAVPSKIYEAMAAGLPIFFSGEGEGAAIVAQNGLGWNSLSKDWKSLKQNLNLMKQLPDDEFHKIKENVRKAAIEKFDRKQQIAEFHETLVQHQLH